MRNPGIRNWFSDRRGNVAITFALAIIPVFGAMGVAVDYSMANSARTNMLASLDATGIALQRQMPLTQNEMDTIGTAFFLGNLGSTPLTNVTVTFVPGNGTITLDSTGTYNTGLASVLKLVGMPTSFPVSAHAQVQWGVGKVEVALALDNTGSMNSSGKLTQLKIAAHNLIDILKNAAKNPGDAKVAIIPFGVQVKINTSDINASWLRWNYYGTCSDSNYDSKETCEGAGNNWTSNNNHSAWTGCVADRDKNNDTTVTAASNNNRRFPGMKQGCGNLETVMPLNYNWGTSGSIDTNTLHGKINALVADGNTNVTIGLAWGFHMVAPTGTLPYSLGAAYNTANLSKYVIILTDGTNTENRFNDPTGTIDARTALACTNIKAAGIKIYAIRVIDGNAALLQNCATNAGMYFDVQDASQLSSVFNSIGNTIANLHLSK
jgi:Flp pilus assembly protein TadG